MSIAKFKVYKITKSGEVSRRHEDLFRNTAKFTAAEQLAAALFSRRIDHKTVSVYLDINDTQVRINIDDILETNDDVIAQARVFCQSLNRLVASHAS